MKPQCFLSLIGCFSKLSLHPLFILTVRLIPILTWRDPTRKGGPSLSNHAMQGDIDDATNGDKQSDGTIYHQYRWRWFMLATLFLLNVSNGMMWLSFAPIANYTAAFYGIAVGTVDWFSLAYFAVSPVVGVVAMFLLDTCGLRLPLYIGAGLNVAGSALRWLSTAHPIVCSHVYNRSGFLVAMLGQVLTACAQPYITYSPTKLASFWFGTKERSLCTNFASVGQMIGIAVSMLVAPYVVTMATELPTLMWVCTIPAAVGAVLTVFAFLWKRPTTHPSPSSEEESYSFFRGVTKVATNRTFWLLLVFWGCASAVFGTLLTLLAQVLCPYGYTDKQAGLWGALLNICGLLGSTVTAVVLDHTKKFQELAVINMAISILFLVLFFEVSRLHQQPVITAFSLCLFGFFALPQLPVCFELGVEVTYPVPEATSLGLLWTASQVISVPVLLISKALKTDLPPELWSTNKCGTDIVPEIECLQPSDVQNFTAQPESNWSYYGLSTSLFRNKQDFTYSMLFLIGLGTVSLVLFVVTFRPTYCRIKAEQRKIHSNSALELRRVDTNEMYSKHHKH